MLTRWKVIIAVVLFFPMMGWSQSYTYYNDIEPIFKKKCFGCHTKGEHFYLFDSYSMVRSKAFMLKYVIENNIMPPWPADDGYQSYKNSRALSSAEKEMLSNWFNHGLTSGARVKGKTVKKEADHSGKSLHIKMPFMVLPASEKDTILKFSIPFEFARSFPINRIQFLSPVLSYIHHINLFIVEDGKTERDPHFVFGYIPGAGQKEFSDGQGFYLPQKGNLIGDVHVPPISKSLKLDLEYAFQISDTAIAHELFFVGRNGVHLTNVPVLFIPHDSIIEVKGLMVIEKNTYITHVIPHMHLLGKSIKAWTEDSLGNRNPLVKIDNWQFDWQLFYEFTKPIFISAGSKVFVEAVYDNTTANKSNPHSPPKDVTEGWFTSQEMLAVYMLGYLSNE